MQARTGTCWHCGAEHSTAHHERLVHNRTLLYGPWHGWRIAGRDLVSPDGDRICPQRLRGLLWTERARARLLQSRATGIRGVLVVLPARA